MIIIDASPSGAKLHSFTLNSLSERMSVREIIRARIYQEVQDFNDSSGQLFHGLVQPSEAENLLNGFKMRKQATIDWEEQFRRACEAFDANGFFMLISDRQAESLDEVFDVAIDTEVEFVKLTPLVGG